MHGLSSSSSYKTDVIQQQQQKKNINSRWNTFRIPSGVPFSTFHQEYNMNWNPLSGKQPRDSHSNTPKITTRD